MSPMSYARRQHRQEHRPDLFGRRFRRRQNEQRVAGRVETQATRGWLVEKQIEVENKRPRGAVFTVTLPTTAR